MGKYIEFDLEEFARDLEDFLNSKYEFHAYMYDEEEQEYKLLTKDFAYFVIKPLYSSWEIEVILWTKWYNIGKVWEKEYEAPDYNTISEREYDRIIVKYAHEIADDLLDALERQEPSEDEIYIEMNMRK